MGTVFSSGWEGAGVQDGGAWDSETGTGLLSVDSVTFFEGAQSLKYSGSGINYVAENVNIATCGVRYAFRVAALANGTIGFFTFYNSGPGTLGYFRITSGGVVDLYWNFSTGYASVGGTWTPDLDTWYQIESLYVQNTSIAWKVWNADGDTLVRTEQSASANMRDNDTDYIRVGGISSPGGTLTVYYDSLVVDNAAYPGPVVSGGEPIVRSTPTLYDYLARQMN